MENIVRSVVLVIVIVLASTSVIRSWTWWRPQLAAVVGAMRGWMVPAGLLALISVVGAIAGLLQVPFMRVGWWDLVGGSGNLLVAQSGNPNVLERFVGLLVPTLLVAAMPCLALHEEESFRRGNERRGRARRVLRAAQFGFVHCIVGVPLAAGAALTIAGAYFDLVYEVARRRALARPELEVTGVRIDARCRHRGPAGTRCRYVCVEEAAEDRRVRDQGTVVAAAAHTVMNWMVLAVLIALQSVALFLD